MAPHGRSPLSRCVIGCCISFVKEKHTTDDFIIMSGPATVGRLKSACGDFSAARIIKAHLAVDKAAAAAASPDGWVMLSDFMI